MLVERVSVPFALDSLDVSLVGSRRFELIFIDIFVSILVVGPVEVLVLQFVLDISFSHFLLLLLLVLLSYFVHQLLAGAWQDVYLGCEPFYSTVHFSHSICIKV